MTPKQRQCLDFIGAYIAEHGFSPSYDEIKDALGIVSKSGVNRIVVELQAQGRIRRRPGYARSIEGVTAPAPVSLASGRADIADRIIACARHEAQKRKAAGGQFAWADLRPIIIDVLGGRP